MADLSDARKEVDYNVDKQEFIKEIYHLIDGLYNAQLNYFSSGIVITFSNGQKFAISLDELK